MAACLLPISCTDDVKFKYCSDMDGRDLTRLVTPEGLSGLQENERACSFDAEEEEEEEDKKTQAIKHCSQFSFNTGWEIRS